MHPHSPSTASPAPGAAAVGRDVLLAVRDLFFRVKLETALRSLGVPFRGTGAEDVVAAVARTPPGVVILDLGDPRLQPLESLRALRARPDLARVPVVGFASHADHELRAAAKAAGSTVVVARSRIAADLPRVLAPFLALPGGG